MDEKKYVLDDKAKNKASVVVVMHTGNKLTESQAAGIKRLVAKSVPKMDMEDVAVIDEGGNEIGGVSGTSQEGVNKLKVKLENELERTIEKKMRTLELVDPLEIYPLLMDVDAIFYGFFFILS